MAGLRFLALYLVGTLALWLVAPVIGSGGLSVGTAALLWGAAFGSRARGGWALFGLVLVAVATNLALVWALARPTAADLRALTETFAADPGRLGVAVFAGAILPALLIAGGVVTRHMVDNRRRQT